MEKFSNQTFGWCDFFQSQQTQINNREYIPGRVAIENKTNYLVITEEGDYIAEPAGRLLYSADTHSDLPKVGDWVLLTKIDEVRAIIHEMLQRKTKLSRKVPGKKIEEQVIATNIDVLFIVQGLDNNFNLARIERYLTIATAGIQPVIVLNKSDLCPNVEELLRLVTQRLPSIPVIVTSVMQQQLDAIRQYMQPGVTFAFVGSSGAGKSSIINGLMGSRFLKTNLVRATDSKGRHTTTRRELIIIDDGSILIDTPGMRELQLWSSEGNLENAFTNIEELSKHCRFKDCSHQHENGCAVMSAMEKGVIAADHYQNYLKLKREMEYLQSLEDITLRQQRKEKVKKIHRNYNKIVRKHPGD
ncbi:MAG: ribosome small subunit-dependent GTPase A [Chitinophagales bacterium]